MYPDSNTKPARSFVRATLLDIPTVSPVHPKVTTRLASTESLVNGLIGLGWKIIAIIVTVFLIWLVFKLAVYGKFEIGPYLEPWAKENHETTGLPGDC